jgi:hypothetical protein
MNAGTQCVHYPHQFPLSFRANTSPPTPPSALGKLGDTADILSQSLYFNALQLFLNLLETKRFLNTI